MGFGAASHHVSSTLSLQPAACSTDHCSSAQELHDVPLGDLPQAFCSAAAQAAVGSGPFFAGAGSCRVQRAAVSLHSCDSSQYGSKLGPSLFQSMGGPGSGFLVH